MDIILLEKIDNIGSIGDRVKVKSGYARNFLIPKGKATLATAENVAKFEKIRVDLEKKAAAEIGMANARAAKLKGQVLRLKAAAGTEGKLFGSIGTIDIAEACQTMLGVEVELHLHTDVNVPITVVIEPVDQAE